MWQSFQFVLICILEKNNKMKMVVAFSQIVLDLTLYIILYYNFISVLCYNLYYSYNIMNVYQEYQP